MAVLTHEVWVRLDELGQSLHACILAGRLGEASRAQLIAEGARLAWTFDAGSHLEAMTIYHERAHGEDYSTDQAWAADPYPEEWLTLQKPSSPMLTIKPATTADAPAALAALVQAFARDPLMLYLFAHHPRGIPAGIETFFSILLRARIALAMPADMLAQDDAILGATMGYDTARPTWPAPLTAEWDRFEASVPEFTARLAAYEDICNAHQPDEPHHYLGVIGVHPSLQGKGAGKALLEHFCERSRADPKSRGVYLDTANAASLQFYYKNGFELRGEGVLEGAPLWCVYKRT